MTNLRLAYIQAYRDRHGRQRYYYRRKGRRYPLPGRPGEAEFMSAYEAAAAEYQEPKSAGRAAIAGTIEALAVHYLQSPEHLRLSKWTRRTYRSEIDRFREEHGASRVTHLQRKHIQAIVAKQYKASGAASANKHLKMIRLLMRLAVEMGWRPDDPAHGIKLYRQQGNGFADWSEKDISKFEKRWPPGSKQRLAMYLALYTGQRRSDLVRMGRQHVRNDAIEVRQQKTGARLLIPIHPKLSKELKASNKSHLTFLVTNYGASFSVAGFGNWFSNASRQAGLKNRSLHGLRKSAARRLAEAGCTSKQIAAVTGHASLREVERYTAAADQERLAREALKKLS